MPEPCIIDHIMITLWNIYGSVIRAFDDFLRFEFEFSQRVGHTALSKHWHFLHFIIIIFENNNNTRLFTIMKYCWMLCYVNLMIGLIF